MWQPILAKYRPALIGDCQKAIAWSHQLAVELLKSGMFQELEEHRAGQVAEAIALQLGDHALTKAHNRHRSYEQCAQMGLVVEALEADQALQEAVLSLHHATIQTLSATAAYKIIENHLGVAFILQQQTMLVQQ